MTPDLPRKTELGDVTLCAIGSTNVELSARALDICVGHCNFADAMLVSDVPAEGSFRYVPIEPLKSRAAYFTFLFKELRAFIKTPFVLLVQWDGYILDPTAWSAEFRNYDYIGARWQWCKDSLNMGNGGFSMRSKRLLDLLAEGTYDMHTNINEDVVICRALRPALEQQYGIRFAPQPVADRFSYEGFPPDAPTFGFHGVFNLWRHIDDTEIVAMLDLMDLGVLRTPEYAKLLLAYFHLRKWDMLRLLYHRWRKHFSVDELQRMMEHPDVGGAPFTFIAFCEHLLKVGY